MALDSTSFENPLLFFPEIQSELNAVVKDAMGKVGSSGFHNSKERVIIAEVFLNRMPNLEEDYRKDLVALIKDAGVSRELKARLKHWESSTTGGSSSLWSSVVSFFSSKEQTSKCLDEAIDRNKSTTDRDFLTTLPGRVSREPLLEQLTQDVVTEAHEYFREFMKKCLPKLYSRAGNIQCQTLYRQVEAEANDQDQKRRASARSDWFNEIAKGQPQVDSGYAQYIIRCN